MVDESKIMVHPYPIWRAKTNYIERVSTISGGVHIYEQLWTRKVEKGLELCCIPVYLYRVALGDVISVKKDFHGLSFSPQEGARFGCS